VPALLANRVERAFVIGFGTGITVGELISLPGVEKVTVAEISPAVVEAAPFFDAANHDVSKSPKVEIIRSDAYRALLRSDERFDVIVSEPGALLSFTGPRVVQQTVREKLPDDFGLAESNIRFGHVDHILARDQIRPFLGRLLALFADDG